MSGDTPSSEYTVDEYADMIHCFLISGKKLELAQVCYANNYPDRRKPELHTLEKVAQKYLDSLESDNTEDPSIKTVCTEKDDRIVKYFITNSHATVKKAASIFRVQTWYIDELLEKRKAEIEAMRAVDEEIRKKEQSSYDSLKRKRKEAVTNIKQEKSDSEEETIIIKDETVIKNELDIEESNIETILIVENNESNNCSEVIKSEIQDVAIICSEDSNDETGTNLFFSENIMNETQDVENFSETRKSETDDDVICLEMEYTKKRKKKYSNHSGTKKLRTSDKRKRKGCDQELITLESSRMLNAIVYTTRLEEMAILHKKIKHLDNMIVMNEILKESKPKYNHRAPKSNINVKRTMSFKLLKIILKKLKKKEQLIDVTDKVDDDKLILTDLTFPKKILTLNAEDTETVGTSNTYNVIVINNLFSNLCDVYVTDSKCNLIEYCCTKLNNINRFDKNKTRLILDACCWIRRQQKVQLIWPRNECNFFRFLITTHKCPPDQCTCCCKPKEKFTEVTLNKPSDTYIFTDKRNIRSDSDEYSTSLISTALRYNKPDTNKNIYPNFIRKNSSRISYLFMEKLLKSFKRDEYFEIGSNQDIERFHTDIYSRDSRQRCNQWANMIEHKRHYKVSVCCKWMRQNFLYAQYKAGHISANTLRFLKGPLLPLRYATCDNCKIIINSKTILSSNLIIDMPEIEHTRTSVKPTLLKIECKDKTPSLTTNRAKELACQILHELKSPDITSTSIKKPTETPLIVKLIITCDQIPGLNFEIDNVNYQIATGIVTKFTQMKFTVKEDLKVVASLNTPMQSTSTDEFQILAQILLSTQNFLKLVPLSPGSDIDLVAKIVIPISQSSRQSDFNTFENVNKDTLVVTEGGPESIVKPIESGNIKDLEAFTNFHLNKPTTKYLNVQLNNTNSIKSKNLGDDDIIEILEDTSSNQNTAYRLTEESMQTRKNKQTAFNSVASTNGRGKNLSKNKTELHDMVCSNFSTDHLGSKISDINYDGAYTSKLNPCDGFANVIRCSKICYTESFKSYLKVEKEATSIVLPKISSVFSLQNSAQQTQMKTHEPLPSTSKAADFSNNLNTDSSIPSTIFNDNINIQNHINTCPPITAQQILLYDPITKMAQIVHLTPNGLLIPVANALNINTPTIKQNIPGGPITMPENNSNFAVLTPVNQICGGTLTPVTLQPVQGHPILPDIINDIPKNIDGKNVENYEIVVKTEADDVVALDSD